MKRSFFSFALNADCLITVCHVCVYVFLVRNAGQLLWGSGMNSDILFDILCTCASPCFFFQFWNPSGKTFICNDLCFVRRVQWILSQCTQKCSYSIFHFCAPWTKRPVYVWILTFDQTGMEWTNDSYLSIIVLNERFLPVLPQCSVNALKVQKRKKES